MPVMVARLRLRRRAGGRGCGRIEHGLLRLLLQIRLLPGGFIREGLAELGKEGVGIGLETAAEEDFLNVVQAIHERRWGLALGRVDGDAEFFLNAFNEGRHRLDVFFH